MPEPAYILKNGTPVPYVPVEVKTARDAYAASLHVLFKHVADFHICIVRTFSTKYGIPEDEILQTIQESDEFKNMKVDPVLDTDQLDTLGYLKSPAPNVKKKPVVSKAKKVIPAVVEPVAEPVVVEEERHDVPIKPKPIRKKVVQKPTTIASVDLFDMDTCATNVIAANTDGTLEAQILAPPPAPEPEPTAPEPIKLKTIKKKVITKPVETTVAPIVAPIVPIVVPIVAPIVPIVVPIVAPMSSSSTEDAPRKIIRKKTTISAV